jgi:hypothetical protein
MESEWQAELILLVALGTLFPSTWACLRMGTELRGLAAVLARHLFPVSLTFSEISFINCFQYLNAAELFVQPFPLALVIYTQPTLYRTGKLANPPSTPFSLFPHESCDEGQRQLGDSPQKLSRNPVWKKMKKTTYSFIYFLFF